MLSVSSYSLKEVIKNFDRKFLFFVETDDGLAMFVPKFLAKILLWKATREEEKFIERSYKKSMEEYPYE